QSRRQSVPERPGQPRLLLEYGVVAGRRRGSARDPAQRDPADARVPDLTAGADGLSRPGRRPARPRLDRWDRGSDQAPGRELISESMSAQFETFAAKLAGAPLRAPGD